MVRLYYSSVAVSSTEARAALGIPIKIAMIEKIESARGTMGRGKRHSSRADARALFFFLPSLPTTQKDSSVEERASVVVLRRYL